MKFRHVGLILLVALLYVFVGFLALYTIPIWLIPASSFADVTDQALRARYVVDSRTSVRAGAVALLASSVLGAAGLAAGLAFVFSRSDARNAAHKQETELFSKALELVGSTEVVVSVAAVRVLTDLGLQRQNLRKAVESALFALCEQRLRLNRALVRGSDRQVADLSHREPGCAAALSGIGRLPLDSPRAGDVVVRSLDRMDLRGWQISGATFEIMNFSGSYLWDARIVDCTFRKCLFSRTDWLGVHLTRVKFDECDFSLSTISDVAASTAVTAKDCKFDGTARPDWMVSA